MSEPHPTSRMNVLLEVAEQQPPEEREAFLSSLEDATLRSQIRSLLDLKEAERTQTIDIQPAASSGSARSRIEVPFEGTARFEPTAVLGTGGFGTVYRVFDRERNTPAALKILRERNSQVLYRFKHEFRTLATLRHPNLLRLYELFADDGRWYFTMELLEGQDFFHHCRAQDFMALRRAMPQLVSALDHLHSQGFLHLDIKPSNVYVTHEGRLVLLDFGMVREIFGIGPQSIALCGTPAFMAPEQIERTAPTAAADWYAVGAMLYEVLTGRLPFTGSRVQMFSQKLEGEPPPVLTLRPGIPNDLARLCDDLLRRDPIRRPAAAEILERLGESSSLHTVAAPPDAFVGRARQLAEMRAAWRRVAEGGTVALNLSGRSGFGKSTLLRAFLDEIARENPESMVLAGRCRQNETVPFKALDEVIDTLSQRVAALSEAEAAALTPPRIELAARLFPVLGQICRIEPAPAASTADPTELRRRAFAVLIELLERIAARAPLVVAIDDLQWGDADSAIFLRELLASRRPPAMLLVCSFRSEDIGTSPVLRLYNAAIEARSAAVETRDLEVGEFAPEESEEYAARLLGGDRERFREIVREGAGNPLLIAQMVRYAEPGRPEPAGLSVQAMILRRLAGLPNAARKLLEAVALADQPLPQSTIQRAAGVDADDFSGAWTLLSERLVRTSEHGGRKEMECYHDKIREAVVARMDAGLRREWHLRLAHALEHQGGVEPALLATHFAGADDSEKTTHYARIAAEAAHFALAFDRAAAFYRMMLEHGKQPPEERRAVYRRMATVLACSGRGDQAAEAYEHAATGAAAGEALDLQRLAAEQYILDGRIEEGMNLLDRVVRSAGMWVPESKFGVLCSLLVNRLRIAVGGLSYRERDAASIPSGTLLAIDVCQTAGHTLAPIDFVRAAEYHARALRQGLRAGEPHRVALVLGREAMDIAARGARYGARSQEIMAMAQTLADRLGDARLQADLAAYNGTRALLTGRWHEAADEFERALRIRLPGHAENAWLYSIVGGLYFTAMPYTGEIRLLREKLEISRRTFEDRQSPFGLVNLKIRAAHLTGLADDDPEGARRELGSGVAQWPTRVYLCQQYFAMCAATEIDLYDALGRPGAGLEAQAYERIRREWKPLRASWLPRMELANLEAHGFRARAAIALAAVDPKRRESLLEAAVWDVKRMIRPRADWAVPLAAAARAGIAAIRGDRERALFELAIAERGFTAGRMPLHCAAAQRQSGILMGGDDGCARIARADEWMRSQTIRNPEKMAHVIVPGVQKNQ